MTAPAPPPPPAEAQLLRRAREAAGLSPETAVARMRAGRIGGSRWRQIEAGYRSDSGKKVVAKDATLAHMALAVGLTPERVAETGRHDAAEIMREIDIQSAKRNPRGPEPAPSTPRVDERWGMIKVLLDQAYSGLTEREYSELVRRVEDHMTNHPEWSPSVGGETDSRPQQALGDG